MRITYETDEKELVKETEWISVENRNPSSNKSIPPEENNQTKEIKPLPPIIVNAVKDYNKIRQILTVSSKMVDLQINNLNTDVASQDNYRLLTNVLNNELHVNWHSYKKKQQRPIKVRQKKTAL